MSIAFATDAYYLASTLVAVKSLVLHVNGRYMYTVYILSERALNPVSRKLFLSAVHAPENVSITFLAVGNRIGNVKMDENGPARTITRATYLRFLLPDLLRDTDKILYMDVDTVALDDAAKVFLIDLEGRFAGGVRDVSMVQDTAARCRELGIDSLDQYVNAGVLLLNLDALRKSGLPRKMLALAAERSFPYNDQDILNILCYGRILFIPHPCNVMVYYLEHPEEISPALGLDYFRETAQPIILHYAGRAKPWYDPKDKRTSPWWQVAASFKGMDRLYFRYCLHKLYKKACPSAK